MISLSDLSPHRIVSFLKHRHTHAESDEVVHVHRDYGSSSPGGDDGCGALLALLGLGLLGWLGYKFVCWLIDVITAFLSWIGQLIESLLSFIAHALLFALIAVVVFAVLGAVFGRSSR